MSYIEKYNQTLFTLLNIKLNTNLCNIIKKYYNPKFLVNNDVLHDMSLVWCYFKKGIYYNNELCNKEDEGLISKQYLSSFKSSFMKDKYDFYVDKYGYNNHLMFNTFKPYFENTIIYGPIHIYTKKKIDKYTEKIICIKYKKQSITGFELFNLGEMIKEGYTDLKIKRIENGIITIYSDLFISNARNTVWDNYIEETLFPSDMYM